VKNGFSSPAYQVGMLGRVASEPSAAAAKQITTKARSAIACEGKLG
jgi:hypothetical protein